VAWGLPLLAAVLVSPGPRAAGNGSPLNEDASKLQPAMAIDLTGSGRDSIVVRDKDGDGFAIFVPEGKDRYALRLYPGAGQDVAGVSYADVNHDGWVDLLALNRDGTVRSWLADGHGDFVPEPETEPAMHHGAHLMMSEPMGAARHARGEGERQRELQSMADLDLPGSWPAGFSPRLAVAGRFTEGGGNGLAVIGEGSRPRLVIAEPRKMDPVTELNRSVSSASLEFVTREVTVANATVTVLVASAGLSFSPDPVNIHVGDTVHWSWAGSVHTVTSGSTCVADNKFCSPSNTNCATAPSSNAGATYDHTFAASGTFPYFCRVHCGLGMVGSVIVQATPSPGAVPDGATVPGAPLTLGKGVGGELTLTWAGSCGGGASDYAIYEGTLPIAGTYNHAAVTCTTANATSANVVPGAGARYYLVVAETAANEGSYGKDTIGGVTAEIPPGAGECHAQILTSCP
jgi:plastocyanin